MIYCYRCSRILNEDVDKCPYCGSVETGSVENGAENMVTKEETVNGENMMSKEESINNENIMARDEAVNVENIINNQSQDMNNEAQKTNTFDTPNMDNIKKDLDNIFEGNGKISQTIETISVESTPIESEPRTPIDYKENVVYKATVDEDEKHHPAIVSVILIICSILTPVIGIIGGIVLMVSDDKSYKKIGITMLSISIIVIVLWVICCCAIGVFGSATAYDIY